MSESSWPSTMLLFGYEQQSKYDFYLVAVTFTILGLSIQTMSPTAAPASLVFELVAWMCLLVAGIAGMSRLAKQPQVWQLMGVHATQENLSSALQKLLLKGATSAYAADVGETVPTVQLAKDAKETLEEIKARVDKLVSESLIRYHLQQWCFAGGLATLAVSRAFAPVAAIVSALRASTG